MQRLLMQELIQWKHSVTRKPLIVQGARQVGKTWLLKEFGIQHFHKYVYLNFESSVRIRNVFENDFSIERLISIFEIESGIQIDTETLIILDEIQEAPKGLTALKYFQESASNFPIVAAGSFLGIALQKERTFPVGKVDFLSLYPLSFEEFLLNVGEPLLLSKMKQNEWEVVEPFHEKLIEYLRIYYVVGGMPEVVNNYFEEKDYKRIRTLQNAIIAGYENDFAKYAPYDIVPKLKLVWNGILSQLAKENKKFIYGQLKQGARAKDFELAITWLEHAGLILKSCRVAKPDIPLRAYANLDVFKLFCLDVGLLTAMAGISEQVLLEKNKVLTEFKGALTEQFVAQQLKPKYELFYWSGDNSQAEIDFVVQKNFNCIPIEVKAEENLKAKSLKVYMEKFSPEIALRASMSFFRQKEKMTNLPLYAVMNI